MFPTIEFVTVPNVANQKAVCTLKFWGRSARLRQLRWGDRSVISRDYANSSGAVGGANSKAPVRFGWPMDEYAAPKYIGMRLMGLADES